MGKARATLRVKANSWHYRLYSFWKRNDFREIDRTPIPGKRSGYRENLCHYWRVVAIWAPLRAFLFAHPKSAPWLRPWAVVLSAVALGGAIAALVLATWASLAWAATIFGALLLVCAGVVLFDHFESQITDFCDSVLDWKHWHRFGAVLTVLGWVIVGLVLTVFFAGAVWVVVTYPVEVLSVVVGAILGFGAYHLGGWLVNKWKGAHQAPPEDTGPGFARVTWEYAVSKKHRICPFIEVEK